jgi:uridine kinase
MEEPTNKISNNLCVIGISGCGGSGKSSLTVKLLHRFEKAWLVSRIHADDHYMPKETIASVTAASGRTYEFDWDSPKSINWQSLEEKVAEEMQHLTRKMQETGKKAMLIIEGFNVFYSKFITSMATLLLFVDSDIETLRRRNYARDNWFDENVGYFDDVLWVAHSQYCTYLASSFTVCLAHESYPVDDSPICRMKKEITAPSSEQKKVYAICSATLVQDEMLAVCVRLLNV